jgi:hypothetical protein
MGDRLKTSLLVGALIRHFNATGGFATVVAKGDETAGAILVLAAQKGRVTGVFERLMSAGSGYVWTPVGPQDVEDEREIEQYLARRRGNDPDLWLIELDTPDTARFVAQLRAFD